MTVVLSVAVMAACLWWSRRLAARARALDAREGTLEARWDQVRFAEIGIEAYRQAQRERSEMPADAIEAFEAGFELGERWQHVVRDREAVAP